VNIPGSSAFVGNAASVAVDGAGDVFFATQKCCAAIDAITGILSLVAEMGPGVSAGQRSGHRRPVEWTPRVVRGLRGNL